MTPLSLQKALRVIQKTPGYVEVGVELAQMVSDGLVRFDAELEDRAQAGLLGVITLGPEAVESSPLSLAQTLVHEHFHLRQNPFLKTVSFWSGILQGAHLMKRYERPAYQAAHDFLDAVKRTNPNLANEAEAEQRAIRQVFAMEFGEALQL
ncbi:hypothetical protein EON80_01080 [bacterium]|nr:MAG: hypothetical protein EON80_01080 [bacterium]